MDIPILKTQDQLYDEVKGDNDEFICEDEFELLLDQLVDNSLIDVGLVSTVVLNDDTYYFARPGLKWKDFCHIDSHVIKTILLRLMQNPGTFFVLMNTQKGKMRITANIIKKWSQNTKRIVTFMIVDNDITLAEQSVSAIERTFGTQPVKLFSLSSNSASNFEMIKMYIDAYAGNLEYPMPVIVLLCNTKQCEKKLRLQDHIDKKCRNGSLLRFAEVWDEADKTYPALRDKSTMIDGIPISCNTFTCHRTDALHELGFVTATEGELLEDYPECANACLHIPDIDPEDEQHYRAFHHADSFIHENTFSGHTHNSYAMHILTTHSPHFMTPITLSIGERYFRKVIINSSGKTSEMNTFAKWCFTNGMYSIVFNGYGGLSLKVYKNCTPEVYKTKGKRLNELLYYLYKKLNLTDKPLIIIGRRKVDRGVGFHYCPRTNDEITVEFEKKLGPLVIKNKDGLVFTDEILGKIKDKDDAVQKAGRCAGIIGDSPQYPGNIHYWTDKSTAQLIKHHNKMVDQCNVEGYTVLQAVTRAEKSTIQNHTVDLKTFLVYTDEDMVREVCDILGYRFIEVLPSTVGPNIGFRETSLNGPKNKASLIDAIKKVPSAYGTNHGVETYRSYYPCYKNIMDVNSLHFVVIIRPGTDATKLDNVNETYPSIVIPQEGVF